MARHQQIEGRAMSNASDPFTLDAADASNEAPNVVAFLLGGVVITGGLLAFLYLDNEPAITRGLAQSDGYLRLDTSERVGAVALRRSLPSNAVITD